MKKHFPFAHSLFMKIAEPRVIRLMQFGIYICMIIAGTGVLSQPPSAFKYVVGSALVYVFGGFITLGAIFGAIAVLPGIWWLERVGIIALTTAMLMYAVIIIALGSSTVGVVVSVAFALTFAQRWLEIRRYQLAPLVPRERN